MALWPAGPYAFVALALVVIGLTVIVRRGVPKAYGLGLLMMAVSFVDTVSFLRTGSGTQGALGFEAARFLAGDAWWTPLTSIFSHAGLGHIVGNLFILVAAGPALEDHIGERKFLVVFFAAGFGALVAHTILAYTTDLVSPVSLAIGASGAIFGILTAFAVRNPRVPLPAFIGFFMLRLPAFVVLLVYLAFNVVYLVADVYVGGGQQVAWWGHFAGFLVGLPFAYTLASVEASDVPAGGKGLPDPEKLVMLATSPATRELLQKVRQFEPDKRTRDDARFALEWVDKLLAKSACPTCGASFTRTGLRATCASGETTLEFAR